MPRDVVASEREAVGLRLREVPAMADAMLFPFESIYHRQQCSLKIAPEQLGLAMVGFRARPELSLAGTVIVTQYRVLFEAVALGPVRGTTTILLDTITDVAERATFPFPRMLLAAGPPYEVHCFEIAPLRQALTHVVAASRPEVRHEARRLVLQVFFPNGVGEFPPRAVVRQALEKLVVTPETVLHALTLHNLWLSLGNE